MLAALFNQFAVPANTATEDPTAPAQLVAGWLYGVSGQTVELRDEILKCYKENDTLTKDVYDAMDAFGKGDMAAGNKAWADASDRFPTAFADCPATVNDPLNDWGNQIEELSERKDWVKIETKIYKDNKAEIDQNTAFEFKTWKEGVYFNTGMFAGRTDKIMLDNAPKETDPPCIGCNEDPPCIGCNEDPVFFHPF